MTCELCGYEPAPEIDLDEAILDSIGLRPSAAHDCVGMRIATAVAKERSRIGVVIRRVAERWKERGAHDLARLLTDVSWAIEQETV